MFWKSQYFGIDQVNLGPSLFNIRIKVDVEVSFLAKFKFFSQEIGKMAFLNASECVNPLKSTLSNPWLKIDLIFEPLFQKSNVNKNKITQKITFENRRKSFESSIWRNTPSFYLNFQHSVYILQLALQTSVSISLFNWRQKPVFHDKLSLRFPEKIMASLNLKNCLSIPDDFDGYSKNLFCIPKHYEACVGNVLIPAGVIQVNFVKSFILENFAWFHVIFLTGSNWKTGIWHFFWCGERCQSWSNPRHLRFERWENYFFVNLKSFFISKWRFSYLGGYRFFSDMLNKLNALNVSNLTESNSGKNGDSVQISIEFIRIKSYHDDK